MDNKIDQIFSNKLGSYSKDPSSRAWNKLESELDKKQGRKAVWWYYVAASLVLIILGYISFPYLFGKDSEILLVKNINNIEKLKPKSPQDITSPIKQNVAIVHSKDIQRIRQARKKSPINTLVKNHKKADKQKLNNFHNENEENKVKEVEMVAENEHTENNELAKDVSFKALTPQILEPVTIVIKRSNVSLVQQEDTTEKASFRNRLGKVYTQVMNLKNGEKVELEELGLKSNLLAFNKRDKQTQNK